MSMLALLLIGVVSIILYGLVKIVYPIVKLEYRRYGLMKKLPGSPINNFILGNLQEFLVPIEELPKSIENLFNRYGQVARMWVPSFLIFFIGRADYAQWFLTSPDAETKADNYRFMESILGKGLVASNGELWRKRRQLIEPSFHTSILASFCGIFADNSIKLIKTLQAQPPDTAVDVMEIMHLLSLDNLAETILNVKINALDNPDHEFRAALANSKEEAMERTMKPWYWNDFLFYSVFPFGRACKKSNETLRGFAENIVRAKQRERAEKHAEAETRVSDEFIPKKKRLIFLDLLLDTTETQTVPLSDKGLMDEVNTIFHGGYDITGVQLGFLLYQLGLHPDIQEKCYKEIDHFFNSSDRKPLATDLKDMEYLSRVIKEGLRLLPAAPVIARKVLRDVQLGDYTIPEGTTVVLDIFHLHRNPEYFSDPMKFDPDRFSPENSANRHPYAFVPFSAGPRNCIGQRFAMLKMKITLMYILRNFILESIHGDGELPTMFATSLQPLHKLETKFLPRNRRSVA